MYVVAALCMSACWYVGLLDAAPTMMDNTCTTTIGPISLLLPQSMNISYNNPPVKQDLPWQQHLSQLCIADRKMAVMDAMTAIKAKTATQ